MSKLELSEVQLLNLSALFTIRDCIQHDVITACCKFGLSAEQAHFIRMLSIDQILVIAVNVGQECLFLPRKDLVSLLSLPTPLTGPIMSAHPPTAAMSQPPSHTSTPLR